ncbi:hypothetical protein EIN_065430 [Entamoeba invadens IP1]|uniref:Uncharacterized protein n=1 Tax=Entamoeba invadens IP1 TaxID=370355 RepID=A0A0A1U058_ENTIV|nr:hypothetical protein EIN_065430 [Entamoeba invadens IP1]ELP84278.1 hypothetical protein EIN_065430 [Entamoeba invadens IP1]|eukprot:XP_004183624.1 hypothetical protein EIN_065430 [Entamoeba invadens IP1]
MSYRIKDTDLHNQAQQFQATTNSLRHARRERVLNMHRNIIDIPECKGYASSEEIETIITGVLQLNPTAPSQLFQLIDNDPVVTKLIRTHNVLPSLKKILLNSQVDVMLSVLDCFINYCYESPECSYEVMELNDMVPVCVSLLQLDNKELNDKTLWLLCNTVSDVFNVKTKIISTQLFKLIPLLAHKYQDQLVPRLSWLCLVLSEIQANGPPLPEELFSVLFSFALEFLDKYKTVPEIASDCLYTFVHLSVQFEYLNYFQNPSLLDLIKSFFLSPETTLFVPAMRFFGNLIIADEAVEYVLNYIGDTFLTSIKSTNAQMLKEVYFFYSNLAATKSLPVIMKCVNGEQVDVAVNFILQRSVFQDTRLEMEHFIVNLFVSSFVEIKAILLSKPRILEALLKVCRDTEAPLKLLWSSLKAIGLVCEYGENVARVDYTNLFEELKVVDTLDEIINTINNNKITNLARQLRDNYFMVEGYDQL